MKFTKQCLLLISGCLLQLANPRTAMGQTKSIQDLKLDASSQSNICASPATFMINASGSISGYPMNTDFLVHIYYGDGKDTTLAVDTLWGKPDKYYFSVYSSHGFVAGSYDAKMIVEMPDGLTETLVAPFEVKGCKTISGKVYADLNGNCAFDAGDAPLPQVHVVSNSPYNATTNANGAYSLTVPDGQNYTVKLSDFGYSTSKPAWINCPSTGYNTVNTLPASDVDFSLQQGVFAFAGQEGPHYTSSCDLKKAYSFHFGAAVIGYNTGQKITITFNFGDGNESTEERTIAAAYDSVGVVMDHTYSTYGNYDVTCKIKGPDGKEEQLIYANAVTLTECALITGRVYADLNGNCTFDGNDLAEPYAKVMLLNSNGVEVATGYASVDGYYTLNAPDKNQTYKVVINNQKKGYSPVYTSICPAGNTHVITSFPAENKDFAVKKLCTMMGAEANPASSCIVPASEQAYIYFNLVGYTSQEMLHFKVAFGDGKEISINKKVGDSLGMVQYLDVTHIYETTGTYSVRIIITDDEGRADTLDQYSMFSITDTCAAIKGKLFVDQNADCIFNGTDKPVRYAMISLEDNGMTQDYSYTDQLGNYYFSVPSNGTGHSYKVKYVNQGQRFNVCPASGEISISALPSEENNFALSCKPGYDLSGNVSGWGFRPGFDASVYISAENKRCEQTNAVIKWVKSPLLTVTKCSPSPDLTVGDTLIWTVNNFSAPDRFFASLNVKTSTSATLDDSIAGRLILENIAGDAEPGDNIVNYSFPIKNSWDPNMKSAAVDGNTKQALIPANLNVVSYTVFFQNTGNDKAYNIFVMDTLDKNINPNTVQIISSSHNMKADMLPGNILKFNFNNIMLEDSKSNEPASHGFVTYTASLRGGLKAGSMVRNTAHIYFDFNPAIITNTTQNELAQATAGMTRVSDKTGSLVVYPNPAQDQFTLLSGDASVGGELQVTDILGHLLLKQKIQGSLTSVSTAQLPTGMYIISVSEGEASYKIRVSVMH